MRFDEVELEAVPLGVSEEPAVEVAEPQSDAAPLLRRVLALLTDVSLFAALVLALSPFLPQPPAWTHTLALGGFTFLLSYYYFVGTWTLWGKTIGGAIFDVKIVSNSPGTISIVDASIRWAALFLSVLTGGIGFLIAVLPSRRSLADRMSGTRAVRDGVATIVA